MAQLFLQMVMKYVIYLLHFFFQFIEIKDLGDLQIFFSESSQHLNLSSACITSIFVTRDAVLDKLKTLDINKGQFRILFLQFLFAKCADGLAYPLQLIFNRSLSVGTFICSWK